MEVFLHTVLVNLIVYLTSIMEFSKYPGLLICGCLHVQAEMFLMGLCAYLSHFDSLRSTEYKCVLVDVCK